MKYRTIQPFIAFGKVADPGDVVDLSDEQAKALPDAVVPYETKVMPPPENKASKKSLPSSRPVRAPVKRMRKK